jgi:hypothetical protein
MKLLHHTLFAIICAISTARGQTAAALSEATPDSDSSVKTQESANFLPGLVARGYLGGDHPPLKMPTPIVFVIKTGSEFPEVIRSRMENELRGIMDVGRLEYAAAGLIILEQDAEVRFDINNMVCKVNGKDFGNGKYTRPMDKGKHSIELIRRGWASGKPSFAIVDAATGQSVLYHTAEALKREVDRSIKVDGESAKSRLLDPTVAAAEPPATAPAAEIVVTAALFGSGTKVADVTERVAGLLLSEPDGFIARSDRLHIDPLPYKAKALAITYEYKGRHCLFVVPAGGRVSSKLLIENAER